MTLFMRKSQLEDENKYFHLFQMSLSLDSGLCVVLIILTALLLAVAVLLFYDFENVCENKNNVTNMVKIPFHNFVCLPFLCKYLKVACLLFSCDWLGLYKMRMVISFVNFVWKKLIYFQFVVVVVRQVLRVFCNKWAFGLHGLVSTLHFWKFNFSICARSRSWRFHDKYLQTKVVISHFLRYQFKTRF